MDPIIYFLYVYIGSIHNKVTKFYTNHQPTSTIFLYPGLGPNVNKYMTISTDIGRVTKNISPKIIIII